MSNAQLQLRIEKVLKAENVNAEAKKMFGGVAFMVNDHMSVGITKKGDLMVRVDPHRIEEVLEWPGADRMKMGNKVMKGFLFVDPTAVESDAALKKWIGLSLEYVRRLPPKAAKKTATKKVAERTAKRTAIRSGSK